MDELRRNVANRMVAERLNRQPVQYHVILSTMTKAELRRQVNLLPDDAECITVNKASGVGFTTKTKLPHTNKHWELQKAQPPVGTGFRYCTRKG